MTVPLFFYDYLYLAVHQARGLSFLQTHWYLTAFYAIPWMLLPVIAWPVAANAANAVTKDKTYKK